MRIARPGLGDQHRHYVRQLASRVQQQLHGVVQRRRVAPARHFDGKQLSQVIAEQRRLQQALARIHPDDVALDRVDLAVVRQVAVGMGQRPAGEGVGREPLVHHADRALHQRVAQFGIELGDLGGQQQPLVYDGPAGKRWNVETRLTLDVALRNLVFDAPPHHIELAVEVFLLERLASFHEDLLDIGLRAACHTPDCVSVHRRIAPAHDLETLFAGDLFHHAFALQALQLAHREKDHAHGVAARLGKLHAQRGAFLNEELMRNLNQHTGAVACLRIAAAGPAVLQVLQHLDALFHDVVALLALDAGDEAHAAGIVLIGRVVEPLRGRQSDGLRLQVVFGVRFAVLSHCSPVRPARLALYWIVASRLGCQQAKDTKPAVSVVGG